MDSAVMEAIRQVPDILTGGVIDEVLGLPGP